MNRKDPSPTTGNRSNESGGAANPGGYDSSQNYGNHNSVFHGDTLNNQSLVERFMKDHQDATLEKGVWVGFFSKYFSGARQQGEQVYEVPQGLHFLLQEAPLPHLRQCLLRQLHPR